MADQPFFRRGTSEIHFVPAVADMAAPTRVEIDAGQNLSEDVANISGFQFENSAINIPNLASSFTGQIDGEDTAGDCALTFYDDLEDETTRTALAKGTNGFIVLMPYGDAPTKRCEVWPVRSRGYNDQWSMGNDAAQAQAQFAITAEPVQDAVIPAAAA